MQESCKALDVGKTTFYRWAMPGGTKRPGPAGPTAEMLAVMHDEVRDLRRSKRRTWGAATIYRNYHGVIPRAVIIDTIREEQLEACRQTRRTSRRYEFIAPDIAWSGDFMLVHPVGRVLRLMDDRARCVLGRDVRDAWIESLVADFLVATCDRLGRRPLFFKHDLGGEFSGGVFQSMLLSLRIIPLPSPPYYPRANGKTERNNGALRQWLGDVIKPNREEVLRELTAEMIDHNEIRPKAILKGFTPRDVYESEARVAVDREALWTEWQALRAELVRQRMTTCGRVDRAGEMEVLRLTALALLRSHGWIKYATGLEAPEVSH